MKFTHPSRIKTVDELLSDPDGIRVDVRWILFVESRADLSIKQNTNRIIMFMPIKSTYSYILCGIKLIGNYLLLSSHLQKRDSRTLLKWSPPILQYLRGPLSPIRSPRPKTLRRTHISALWRIPGVERAVTFSQPPAVDPGWSVAMATNREQQVGHMTGFPPAVYPFPFNSMRSHSPFDLLANSSLFGRFGADLPKEMAALCKSFSLLCVFVLDLPFLSFSISVPRMHTAITLFLVRSH